MVQICYAFDAQDNFTCVCLICCFAAIACDVAVIQVFMWFASKSAAQTALLSVSVHFRTLAAADNAVMLVDGAKGIEPQTRKLFAVARLRGLPIFTFINKMDRPALNGFEIIEQLEKEFGLASYPVTWPIGSGNA